MQKSERRGADFLSSFCILHPSLCISDYHRTMRILGIDPGLRLTGYGVIDYRALKPLLIDGGVIRLTEENAHCGSAAGIGNGT